MSSTKRVIAPFPVIEGVMPNGVTTGKNVHVLFLDYALFDINWSGNTTNGVVTFQILKDGKDTWETLAIPGEPVAVSGSTGNHKVLFESLLFKEIRAIYTSNSGGETVSIYVTAKES
jgi:hypothetical protein